MTDDESDRSVNMYPALSSTVMLAVSPLTNAYRKKRSPSRALNVKTSFTLAK